jgi:hypothetical protein
MSVRLFVLGLTKAADADMQKRVCPAAIISLIVYSLVAVTSP